MSYDIKAVETFITDSEDKYGDSGWGAWSWGDLGPVVDGDEFTVECLVGVSETGGEGSQEAIYLLFKVTGKDGTVRHFQKNGYYASYDGSNWDGDFFEVEPVQVQRTEYKAVKA